MDQQTLSAVQRAFEQKFTLADRFEIYSKQVREKLFGVDLSIFDQTIAFYREAKSQNFTRKQAFARALDKASHKTAWFEKNRETLDDKMHFYQEVNIYPFRQPYNKRFGGYRWYLNLVSHKKTPTVLEYGCGSAVLTEHLIRCRPNARYVVADIPSVTLEFVKWKKAFYQYPYEILTIGPGKEGIPLNGYYDLIICEDVLEHTPNPLEIVSYFIEHLSPGGVLKMDFMNHPGGENLNEAVEQREATKALLKERLTVVKAVDEPGGNNGVYVKA